MLLPPWAMFWDLCCSQSSLVIWLSPSRRKHYVSLARINNILDWNETHRPNITDLRTLLTAVIYKMHTTSWPPDLTRMLLSHTWPEVQLAPAMLCHVTRVNQSQEPTPLARTSLMHLETDSKLWRWRNQWHWSPVLQIPSSLWFAFKIMTYRENVLAAVNHRLAFSVYYCSLLSLCHLY